MCECMLEKRTRKVFEDDDEMSECGFRKKREYRNVSYGGMRINL